MKSTRRDKIRCELVLDAILFKFHAGSAGTALPAVIPPPAKGEPLFALLRAWDEAARGVHALETRWHRALIRLIPPEYRAEPFDDPERTIYQALDDPKVSRLQRFRDAARAHEKTMRRRIVNTPAHTLEGTLAKLRNATGADRPPLPEGRRYRVDDDVVRSALADLERLGSRAA